MGGTALLDDDDRFADLPPLPLTAPDATAFTLPPLASLAGDAAGEAAAPVATDARALLAPAGRAAEPGAALSPAQLANQVPTLLLCLPAATLPLPPLCRCQRARERHSIGADLDRDCQFHRCSPRLRGRRLQRISRVP